MGVDELCNVTFRAVGSTKKLSGQVLKEWKVKHTRFRGIILRKIIKTAFGGFLTQLDAKKKAGCLNKLLGTYDQVMWLCLSIAYIVPQLPTTDDSDSCLK